MLNLVEITPAATGTGVINDVNSFANAGAATFSIDLTLYLWFGNRSLIFNPANPGSAGLLILIAEDAKSLATDAVAINNSGNKIYPASGAGLWSVNITTCGGLESEVFIERVVESIESVISAYTLDGMPFDDN